ncbi:MAG TPA: hypothetical protein VFG70_09120, partial [Gaiellaceae bacterium]|nr:hypothetical protein [Gaiellaceae bacterium]
MRPVWLRLAIVVVAAGMFALPGSQVVAATAATSGTSADAEVASSEPCPQFAPDASSGGGWGESDRVTEPCIYPVISLSADPSSVEYGGWSTVHWSVANAMHGCTNWSNPSTNFGGIAGAGSGAVAVGPLYGNTTFHVRCDNGNGAIAENYTGVSVGAPPPPPPPPPPTCPNLALDAERDGALDPDLATGECVYPVISLSAAPSSVEYGGWSTISWNVTNAAHGCTNWSNPTSNFGGISGPGSGTVAVGPLYGNTTFHVRCDNGNGAIAENYTGVSVGAPPPPPPPDAQAPATPTGL